MQTGFHRSHHPEQSDAMKENTIKENQGDRLETMMTADVSRWSTWIKGVCISLSLAVSLPAVVGKCIVSDEGPVYKICLDLNFLSW